MPTIDSLVEKTKKWKKSTYRPWNYMDEIEKEENENKVVSEILQQPVDNQSILQSPISIKKADALDQQVKDKQADVSQYETDQLPNEEVAVSSSQENKLSNLENLKKNKQTATEIIVDSNISIDSINQKHELEIKKKSIRNQYQPSAGLEVAENLLDRIFRLSGHQKKLFLFIVERCFSRGLLSTGAITSDTLVDVMNTSLKMIKTTIQRLVLKSLVIRERGKTGRGGFYSFAITESIRNAALEYKRLISSEQALSNNQKSIRNQLEIIDSTNIFSENAGTGNKGLPNEWNDIDIEPLEDIGFTKEHIMQLFKLDNLDPGVIQNSIYHFAHDIQYNNKKVEIKKTSPLGYFMGILRKTGLYTAPNNYESPKARQMRIYYEQQKAEEEKIKAIEDKLIDIHFKEWENHLNDDEKKTLLPEEVRSSAYQAIRTSYLRKYFVKEIWPKKCAELDGLAQIKRLKK